jgi:hypothetical protein
MTTNLLQQRRRSGDGVAQHVPPAQVWILPAGLTVFLWWTSINQITFVQLIVAYVLMLLPCWSYHQWRRTGYQGLPLFSIVGAMYCLYFVMPLFWQEWRTQNWFGAKRLLSSGAITEVMLLILLGMACLWLGTRSSIGSMIALKHFLEISTTPFTVLYVQGVATVGTIMERYSTLQEGGGQGWRQIILIMESSAAQTALMILLLRVLDRKAGKGEKVVLFALIGLRVILGVSSGWVGTAVALAVSCSLAYMRTYHKLPIVIVACVLPYVLFLQPGKMKFRQVFWQKQMQASPIEKIEFWVDESLKAWQQAFEDPSGKQIPMLLSYTFSRTSLLAAAANVVEQTPSVVPYQHGRLYSYLVVSLIPRALWPDKPSMNEANQFYQVAYGITRVQDLNSVSIAIGMLTEGYINFGWFGCALAMFVVGVVLDFWNRTFFLRTGSVLALAIGLALVPQLFFVEMQMAQYLSGFVQHVVFTVVVFLPVLRWRTVVLKPAKTRVLGMAGVRP